MTNFAKQWPSAPQEVNLGAGKRSDETVNFQLRLNDFDNNMVEMYQKGPKRAYLAAIIHTDFLSSELAGWLENGESVTVEMTVLERKENDYGRRE